MITSSRVFKGGDGKTVIGWLVAGEPFSFLIWIAGSGGLGMVGSEGFIGEARENDNAGWEG